MTSAPARPDPEGDEPERLREMDVHGTADATLGGYFREHDRPPAFEGSDGDPYTVSMEVEKVGDLEKPYVGYLVFPRWAGTGLGVVDHVETPILLSGSSRESVLKELGQLSLFEVQHLLEEALRRREQGDDAP